MNFRRYFPVLVLTVVGLTGFAALQSEPAHGVRRFEAHEFAVFRSTYESLRIQSTQSRAEHFRGLAATAETAALTPGMTQALIEFCQSVIAAEDESMEVKTEVRSALAALEGRSSGRVISEAENEKRRSDRKPASVN